MKREGRLEEARNLLLGCVKWLETNHELDPQTPPWYYEQLAIVYRKLKQNEEANKYTILYEDVVIQNFLHAKNEITKNPKWLRDKYWPDGPVITKEVARILEKRGLPLQ